MFPVDPPLDPTLDLGQTGHKGFHERIHAALNALKPIAEMELEDVAAHEAFSGTSRSDSARRTSGPVTKNSNTFTAFNSAGGDDLSLTVAAQVGDRIMVYIAGTWNNEAVAGRATAATMVGGAAVTWLCSRAGTAATYGIPAWSGQPSVFANIGAPISYVVQAADVENGQVTVQFFAKSDSASTKNLNAATTSPIDTAVVNMGKG